MSKQTIIMLCGPARCGKDTIGRLLKDTLSKSTSEKWFTWAFADQLRIDLKSKVREKYGVDIHDESKKHLFRPDMIEYGQKKREETGGRYLIDKFIEYFECNDSRLNWIITDFRFINEYEVLQKELGDRVLISPVYIERYIQKGQLKFTVEPTIEQEIENYPEIRKIAVKKPVEWKTGYFWKYKLRKELSY